MPWNAIFSVSENECMNAARDGASRCFGWFTRLQQVSNHQQQARSDSQIPEKLLEAKVDKETSAVGPTPHAQLGNLQLAQLPNETVHGRVDRSSSRIADDERLRWSEIVQGRKR